MIWYFRYVSVAFFIGAIIKFKQKQNKDALIYLISSMVIMVCTALIPEFMIYPFRG